jgi:hypothetical protein
MTFKHELIKPTDSHSPAFFKMLVNKSVFGGKNFGLYARVPVPNREEIQTPTKLWADLKRWGSDLTHPQSVDFTVTPSSTAQMHFHTVFVSVFAQVPILEETDGRLARLVLKTARFGWKFMESVIEPMASVYSLCMLSREISATRKRIETETGHKSERRVAFFDIN